MGKIAEQVQKQFDQMEKMKKLLEETEETMSELDNVFCKRCPLAHGFGKERSCPTDFVFGDEMCLVRSLFEHRLRLDLGTADALQFSYDTLKISFVEMIEVMELCDEGREVTPFRERTALENQILDAVKCVEPNDHFTPKTEEVIKVFTKIRNDKFFCKRG